MPILTAFADADFAKSCVEGINATEAAARLLFLRKLRLFIELRFKVFKINKL
jgi:hypothetical protein